MTCIYDACSVLSKGIGDSAQGFANCVLFVFLVPSVRDHYRRALCSKCLTQWTATDNDTVERRHRDAGDGAWLYSNHSFHWTYASRRYFAVMKLRKARLQKLVCYNKKLSCRRETGRRFVSLNFSLSHSRSRKVIRNDTLQ